MLRALRTLPLLLMLAIAGAARADTVDMLLFENPGLFDVSPQGEVGGPGARLLQRVSTVSGVGLRLQVMPIARILLTLEQQPGTCAAGLARTPEREAALRWAGPVSSSAMVLYGRLDEKRSVQGLEDLRGAVIAAQRQSVPVAWLRDHGLQVQEARDAPTALRMLQAQRVDYWLVNDLLAQHTFRGLGSTPARPLHTFGRIDGYLVCHRDTPAATMARFQGALDQLRRDGELAPFGLR